MEHALRIIKFNRNKCRPGKVFNTVGNIQMGDYFSVVFRGLEVSTIYLQGTERILCPQWISDLQDNFHCKTVID